VLSRAVTNDPSVRPLLTAVPAREESVPLKGFAEPTSFERLTPDAKRLS